MNRDSKELLSSTFLLMFRKQIAILHFLAVENYLAENYVQFKFLLSSSFKIALKTNRLFALITKQDLVFCVINFYCINCKIFIMMNIPGLKQMVYFKWE